MAQNWSPYQPGSFSMLRTYIAALATIALPAVLSAQSTSPVADAFRDNAKSEGTNRNEKILFAFLVSRCSPVRAG